MFDSRSRRGLALDVMESPSAREKSIEEPAGMDGAGPLELDSVQVFLRIRPPQENEHDTAVRSLPSQLTHSDMLLHTPVDANVHEDAEVDDAAAVARRGAAALPRMFLPRARSGELSFPREKEEERGNVSYLHFFAFTRTTF